MDQEARPILLFGADFTRAWLLRYEIKRGIKLDWSLLYAEPDQDGTIDIDTDIDDDNI